MEPSENQATLEEEYKSKSEEDVQEDLDQISERVSSEFMRESERKAVESLNTLSKLDESASITISARESLEEIELSDMKMEGQNLDRNDPKLEELKQAVEEGIESMKSKRTLRNYVAKHWMALTFGILGVLGTSASIALSALSLAGKGDDEELKNYGLTDEEVEHIKELVQTWIGTYDDQHEDEYWEKIAQYVDQWNTSAEAQILFMRYTEDLYGPHSWTWDQGEPAQKAEELVETFATAKKFSSIYEAAKAYRNTADPPARPPRNAVATLCELALGTIRKNLLLQGGE